VGGLIAWMVIKDTDPKYAKKLLVFGLFMTALPMELHSYYQHNLHYFGHISNKIKNSICFNSPKICDISNKIDLLI